jgi:hypothetical protein
MDTGESLDRQQVSAGGSACGTTSPAAFMTIRGPKAHRDRRKRLVFGFTARGIIEGHEPKHLCLDRFVCICL